MVKRNAKNEPVPEPVEELSEDLEELDLDGDSDEAIGSEDESGGDGAGDADAAGADDEGEEDEGDVRAGSQSDDGDAEGINDAMLEYMAAAAERMQRRAARAANGHTTADAGAGQADQGDADSGDDDSAGEEAVAGRPVDPGSDSSEDERPSRNTVGGVPLKWYKDEEHIGYDVEGQKLLRKERKDKLQQLLDRNDSKKALRTIYDPYNDEEITLSKEELTMVMRIRKGQFPHVSVNPFEPYDDYFTREREVMPILDAPEPKRRFVPSKWEEKKIVQLVRAIRKGWIKVKTPGQQEDEKQEPPAYLLWGDDGLADAKTGSGLTYIPAAKPRLPGHAESYNPPAEYLPTEEERTAWEMMDPEDRPADAKILPQAFSSLRHVPAYKDFIKERFERCLDLYLCPRIRRKRLDIKPEQLVPQLPKPRDLQPFPTTLVMTYKGHAGRVNSIAADPWVGQWLLSGSDDGTLRLWEVRSGRCCRTWHLDGGAVCGVAWCPNPGLRIASAVVGSSVVLLGTGTGTPEVEEATARALEVASTSGRPAEDALATWSARQGGGVTVVTKHPLKAVSWHARGDFFSTVAPTGNTQAVVVHQLSKQASQNPFRKNRGRVIKVAFHPTKPFFFVATQNHVRVYNLAQQALAKKLIGGGGCITSLAVHPTGDHVLVGSDDRRVAWYDMDLSTKPYKAMRYHHTAVRGVAYHRSYPLFASCADEDAVQVFHGMVYSDLLTNPLIVPVKILRGGHTVPPGSGAGVLDVAFHPNQPWLFTAGADTNICLYCN